MVERERQEHKVVTDVPLITIVTNVSLVTVVTIVADLDVYLQVGVAGPRSLP